MHRENQEVLRTPAHLLQVTLCGVSGQQRGVRAQPRLHGARLPHLHPHLGEKSKPPRPAPNTQSNPASAPDTRGTVAAAHFYQRTPVVGGDRRAGIAERGSQSGDRRAGIAERADGGSVCMKDVQRCANLRQSTRLPQECVRLGSTSAQAHALSRTPLVPRPANGRNVALDFNAPLDRRRRNRKT